MNPQHLQKSMVRWAFNFEEWKPTSTEWDKLLKLVQPEERERIGRFKRPIGNGVYLTGKDNPDAKSSLVGRLMQRKLVHDHQAVPYASIKLQRTAKGKPFFDQSSCTNQSYPNFNFNVSHQGDFVIGGCESEWLLGVDVMKVELRGNQKRDDFFRDMKDCFTTNEWKTINSYHNPLESFYQHWCLKEGYIKAVGIGLGFELQRAEFTINFETNTATIAIDRVKRDNWHFELHHIDALHVAAVAYGPPSEADPCSQGKGINMDHKIAPEKRAVDILRIPFEIIQSIDQLVAEMV